MVQELKKRPFLTLFLGFPDKYFTYQFLINQRKIFSETLRGKCGTV